MGVEYRGVGGIGVRLTDDMVRDIVDSGVISQRDWDVDGADCLPGDGGDFDAMQAGNSWGGDTHYYLMMKSETLSGCWDALEGFMEALEELGMSLSLEDVKVVSDIYVY
jgi:hypothetical protein